MKTITIGEILTKEQIRTVQKIWNSKLDNRQKTAKVKEYLGQFRAELEAKEMMPEYLAYAIEYALTKYEK